MSEGDEDPILDWFDKEYPTGDAEDHINIQFEKDTLKAKKASKKAWVPYDSDKENDPFNIQMLFYSIKILQLFTI